MAKKSKKFPGVYSVKGKKGVSYGVDYIHPQTNERVRKILKGVTSMEKAAEIRSIELADASRGLVNQAYNIKDKPKVISFEAMVKAYLEWAKENRKDWKGKEYIADHLLKAFKGKLLSDINSFIVEKFKMAGQGCSRNQRSTSTSLCCGKSSKKPWTGRSTTARILWRR